MKKLILVLAMVSTSAFAQHHGHYNGGSWVAPLIIGGIIGYSVRQPQVIVNTLPVYNNSTPIYNLPRAPQNGTTPIYEKRTQYDFNCACYIVVYNQIGWQ